jgi:hypothetical protein
MYIAHSIERLEENHLGTRIETSSATLSGQPATKLVATSGGGDFQTVQILAVFGNNLAYIAQYSSARENNDVNLQAMQQIVESVEINPLQSWSHVVATSIRIAASAIGGVVAVKLLNRSFMTSRLLRETRRLFLAALGIETLCVASAEIGGIMGFYFFGFSALGIVMSYMLPTALQALSHLPAYLEEQLPITIIMQRWRAAAAAAPCSSTVPGVGLRQTSS